MYMEIQLPEYRSQQACISTTDLCFHSRLVSPQWIEKNIENVSFAYHPSSCITFASVCHRHSKDGWDLKPALLIEVKSSMERYVFCLTLQRCLPNLPTPRCHFLLPALFIFDVASCFLLSGLESFYLDAIIHSMLKVIFEGLMRRDESLEQATSANIAERRYMANDYTNWMTRRIRTFAHACSPSVVDNAQQAFHSLSIPRPHVVTSNSHSSCQIAD